MICAGAASGLRYAQGVTAYGGLSHTMGIEAQFQPQAQTFPVPNTNVEAQSCLLSVV